jgi:hypothetical protein
MDHISEPAGGTLNGSLPLSCVSFSAQNKLYGVLSFFCTEGDLAAFRGMAGAFLAGFEIFGDLCGCSRSAGQAGEPAVEVFLVCGTSFSNTRLAGSDTSPSVGVASDPIICELPELTSSCGLMHAFCWNKNHLVTLRMESQP